MMKGGKKNKRRARGSIEEDDTNNAKRPNMADSNGVSFPRQHRTRDESNRIKRDVIQYLRNLIDDETEES